MPEISGQIDDLGFRDLIQKPSQESQAVVGAPVIDEKDFSGRETGESRPQSAEELSQDVLFVEDGNDQ
jgi:hypothetical protein